MADSQVTARQTSVFSRLSAVFPALIEQYAVQKAPHALLLTGQVGVGKATLAVLLSQALLCEKTEKPCGECPGCHKARNYSHANLLVVKAAENQRSVKVEQARALLANLATYPFSAGPRVVLLEQVDTFTPQAQNALLKALEEPDSATFFLLTCENLRAVLTTIRSRCQTLYIPPWPDELVSLLLTEQGIPADEAGQLSGFSGGSPGKAMQIRNDPAFWSVKTLADDSILTLDHIRQLPAVSRKLREAKDKADMLLDYVEDAALRQIKKNALQNLPGKQAQSMLEGVLAARRHQASNLSWQAIVDCLLLKILEDNTECPM